MKELGTLLSRSKELDDGFVPFLGGKAKRCLALVNPARGLRVGLGSLIEKQLDDGLVPEPGGKAKRRPPLVKSARGL